MRASANHRILILTAAAMAVWSGCATGSAGPRTGNDDQARGVRADIDPARAYLSLDEIEPRVEPPRSPESLKPLSARGARQLSAANELVAQQRYTEASIQLERALRFDPNHPDIHSALAVLHWEAGNSERAKTCAVLSLQFNPDNTTARYVLGRYEASMGDNTAAITAYRTALLSRFLSSNPETEAACHLHLAGALRTEGYLEAALEQYRAFELQTASPDVLEAHAKLATLAKSQRRAAAEAKSDILERLGRFADAAEALASLPLAPTDVAGGLRCARLWLRAGRHDRALETARAIQSDDDEIIRLLLEIHEATGHPDRIVDDLRGRITERPDDPKLRLSFADVLVRLDRDGEARRELEEFLQRHASARFVRLRLIDLLTAQSAWAEALATAAEGVKRQPARAADFEAKIVQLADDPDAVAALCDSNGASGDHITDYLRAMLALATARTERAAALLETAHSKNVTFVPTRIALARLHLKAYRYGEALEIAGRTDEDIPEDATLERLLGDIHERLDDLEQAELHYKAAIQLNRADCDAMLALAKVLRRSREVNRSLFQLRVLLDQNPHHMEAREMLAFTYLEQGRTDLATEQLQQMRKHADTPASKARADAWLTRLQHPNPQAYRSKLIEFAERNPGDAGAWLAVAGSYDEFEQDHAREACLKALSINPDFEEAALGLIFAEKRLLNFEAAAARLEMLLPRRPNRHAWRRDLIGLHRIVVDYEAALAVARREQARKDIDGDVRWAYRLDMLRALDRLDRPNEVIELLRAWAQTDPDDPRATARLGQEYIRQDQPEKAVDIFETLYQSDADDRSSLLPLITALTSAKRHDRAAQYVLDWINDDPENDQALSVLALVLDDAELVDNALELVNNRLLHTAKREQFQNLAVEILARAERFKESLDLSERLIDEIMTLMHEIADGRNRRESERLSPERLIHRPNEPFLLDSLGERLVELRRLLVQQLLLARDYREAEDLLTDWIEVSQDRRHRFGYLLQLSLCQQAQGHDEPAAETLERAWALAPDSVGLNNDVAYYWIDRGERMEEAERMIRYALSHTPTQSAYLDTYGWLLYKKGLFAEATKWLVRAAHAGEEEDAAVLDHLGDACWRLGETQEAVEHWTAAVAAAAQKQEQGENDVNSDERRVLQTTQSKIDNAQEGRTPSVASLAGPQGRDDSQADDAP